MPSKHQSIEVEVVHVLAHEYPGDKQSHLECHEALYIGHLPDHNLIILRNNRFPHNFFYVDGNLQMLAYNPDGTNSVWAGTFHRPGELQCCEDCVPVHEEVG